MWSALQALSENEEGLSLLLTPLERTIALAVFSSLSPADLFDFADETEAQEARDAFETIAAKLMGALNE